MPDSQNQPSQPSTKAIKEFHPYQKQALDIFASAWANKNGDSQHERSSVSKALARCTVNAEDPDADVYIWSTILAIKQFATTHPQALDFLLLGYSDATRLYPDTVSNEYGHGPAAGLQQLKWWIIEESDGFQGLLFPTSIGSVHPTDRSNLSFMQSDVNEKLDQVLTQINDWRGERTSWIIAAAIQARCFALDIIRVNDGRQIEALIDAGFHRQRNRWSKADFIGACVLLRGCAKSLISQLNAVAEGQGQSQDRSQAWKEALHTYLVEDVKSSGKDFEIKYHAALALQNLKTGPRDETSDALFLAHAWIF
ncbi:MAG: hypothetical protein ASARMPRED_000885 [Alectoria sarmentosa]|nr:MAG: hypothetical protein ASARMPRED_000885 [Alectoria sarmentosa]